MKVKKIPMRMCVGCKELKPKKELLRIVVLPTGVIEVDRTGKNRAAACMYATAWTVSTKPMKITAWKNP